MAHLIKVLDYPLSVDGLTCFVDIDMKIVLLLSMVQSTRLHLWPYRFHLPTGIYFWSHAWTFQFI